MCLAEEGDGEEKEDGEVIFTARLEALQDLKKKTTCRYSSLQVFSLWKSLLFDKTFLLLLVCTSFGVFDCKFNVLYVFLLDQKGGRNGGRCGYDWEIVVALT